MEKEWLVLGLTGKKKPEIIAECTTVEAANRVLDLLSRSKRYSEIFKWVEARSIFEGQEWK